MGRPCAPAGALIALALALLLASPRRHRGRRRPGRPGPQRRPGRQGQGALQAKLDAQHAEVERLAERLNATDDRRQRLQQRLARLARQAAAQAQLDEAQRQLDEQARATYMNGPQWLLGELVGGTNPPDAMRQLPMTKAALEARAAVVADVRIRKAEVDTLNERVATDLAEADLVHKRQDDERRQVQRLVEQPQQTLDKIDEQLAGYLEAEQGRAEAARPPGPATCPGSGRSSPGRRPGRWPGRPSAGRWPSSATPTAGARPGPTSSTARG